MNSGIYVPNDDRWPAHFRGIGIRIEDSVCVDDEHPYVLTTEAVKEVTTQFFFVFLILNLLSSFHGFVEFRCGHCQFAHEPISEKKY